MADWAGHLLWFEDGRFANHQYFKICGSQHDFKKESNREQ